MTRNGDKFIEMVDRIRKVHGVDVKVRGDYFHWPDGRQERITDPRYWVARREIQDRIGDR